MGWRSLRRSTRTETDIKMTPMIDVVFLLLIYFLCTASFQLAEFDHQASKIETQGSELIDLNDPPPPEADFQDIIIRIQGTASALSWSINGTPFPELAAVKDQLQRSARNGGQSATVILHPDDEVPIGDVMDVFDAAKACAFDTVSFAATPQQP